MKKIILAGLITAFLSGCSIKVAPDTKFNENNDVLVKTVVYDEGGFIDHQAMRIERLNENGTRVEIRGVCLSSCTMYLGADDVCVSPNAYLGFHGAMEFYFVPATPTNKMKYDTQMASFYPPNLKEWFMNEGRNTIFFWTGKSGQEVYNMDPEHVELCQK